MRKLIALVFTLLMTALTVVLRLGLIPAVTDFESGAVKGVHIIIGVMLLTVIVDALLCIGKRNDLKSIQKSAPVPRFIGGFLSVFAGSVLLLTMLFDTVAWIGWNQVPPPNTAIINVADGITLVGTLLFGAIGGIALIWQGYRWLTPRVPIKGGFYWLMLAPSAWIWFRLARYEISYSSTVDIVESFFDFILLISLLLFLFGLARYVTGIGSRPPKYLLFFAALVTILAGGSASVVAVGAMISGSETGFVTSLVDASVSLLALYVALMQVFGSVPYVKPLSEKAAEKAEEAAPAPLPEDPDDAVDAILSDYENSGSETE